MTDPVLALTVGMLLGCRARAAQGRGSNRAAAGVRTFAPVAGGVSWRVGGAATAAVALGFVALAAVVHSDCADGA